MEALLPYILKASGILFLFHAAYEIFLKRETFFKLNRGFLLGGLLMAVIHPLLKVKHYVELFPSTSLPTGNEGPSGISPLQVSEGTPDFMIAIKILFILGMVIMGIRFLIQLFSIRKLISTNRSIKNSGYTLVEINQELAPFSFFHYIFYNPAHYPAMELEAILEHEKVHCRQWHSLDVLMANVVFIVLWVNPFGWLYLKNIKQNLEFLADREATSCGRSLKAYQYTLLKVSAQPQTLAVSNSFYNSLIKKRIVMLNQTKSKKSKAFKTLIIVPVLALFLYAFNSETVYLPAEASTADHQLTDSEDQTIKIHIDKDTSDKELKDLKKDLRKKGIDFSYTVVHNEKQEIIDISITITTEEKGNRTFAGSSSFNNDGKPIDPVNIIFDGDKNFFFTGKEGEEMKIIHEEKDHSTWVFSDDDARQTVEIYKDDGVETIKVNGKEVSRDEFENMEKEGKLHGTKIKIRKIAKDDHKGHVMIMSEHESDHDVEVISGDGGGFFFMDGALGDEWMILLDGKVVSQEEVKTLEPDEIETINVIKGKKAAEKYGKEIEYALEISTKQ